MLLASLVLAVRGTSLREALTTEDGRHLLKCLLSAEAAPVKPSFLRAVLAREPWLALNNLPAAQLDPWGAEIAAMIASPRRHRMLGVLPARPRDALAALKETAKHVRCTRDRSMMFAFACAIVRWRHSTNRTSLPAEMVEAIAARVAITALPRLAL